MTTQTAPRPPVLAARPWYQRPARVLLLLWWVGMTLGTHWPRFVLEDIAPLDHQALPYGLDKWAHFGAFAGLSFLFLLSNLVKGSLQRQAVLGVGLLVAWAVVDESTQAFVPGRSPHWHDWVASSLGVCAGASVWVGLRRAVLSHDGSFVGHLKVVSGMTLLSRVFGLVRDWSLARVFGFGTVMDAFLIAFMAPNLFRRLFGEGALAAAFIPHYSRLRQRDERAAVRLAVLVVDVLAGTLVLMSIIGAASLGALAWWGPLETRGTITAGLTAVTLWYMPMVCVTAILGAILQVHNRFAVPAATPIVLNLFVIAAAFGTVLWPGVGGGEGLAAERAIFVVAGAILLAGIVQLAWQVIALRREGVYLRRGPLSVHRAPAADATDAREELERGLVREAGGGLLRQWAPTVLGLAIFQLNTLADKLIALFFSGTGQLRLGGREVAYPMAEGSVSVLGMAQRLYEFPLGVFGIAVGTAIFPALSAAAAADPARFASLVRQGLRLTFFIGLPASVGLFLVREPLAGTIFYEGGALEAGDASRVAWVLAGYAVAVWAFSMNQVLVRAFYARHDAKTPMRVGVGMVVLNVCLNLTLIWPLGVAGLAWSTSICAVGQSALLLWLLGRQGVTVSSTDVWAGWGRTAAVSGVMGVAVWVAIGHIELEGTPWTFVAGTLAVGVAAGVAVVGAGAVLLRMGELCWLVQREANADARSEPRP